MFSVMCGDIQTILLATIGLAAILPLRTVNKELKRDVEDYTRSLKEKGAKWNVEKLRQQTPFDYLRNVDHVSQEEREKITNRYQPQGRAPALIRQNADLVGLLDVLIKLRKWDVVYQLREGELRPWEYKFCFQDYYWTKHVNHPKKSEMLHKETRYQCVNHAAHVAKHERVFKCI